MTRMPPGPSRLGDLDLMKRLQAYARGEAQWDAQPTSSDERAACGSLYEGLVRFISKCLVPILSRIAAREMETFTMHDERHGLKVAHLMWNVMRQDRRERLTPPEIGLLVASAYFHDVGMALSAEDRQRRLARQSDLWSTFESDTDLFERLEALREATSDPKASAEVRTDVSRRLCQAEEAILCRDTRDRHGTVARYREVLSALSGFHRDDPANIPDPDGCLVFQGDDLVPRLVEISASHVEDADDLLARDPGNGRRRFPRDYPVGSCQVDLLLVAAALRLADILDFDRERTPPVLFHYLMPGALANLEGRSPIEWKKHLAISNWEITEEIIVFRGHCDNHVVHHAIVEFCRQIEREIQATRLTFSEGAIDAWPFILPSRVKTDIHEEGYTYYPYRFELDDDRVYGLLMGAAIYEEPLAAVRELIQNAVDACSLRDQLTRLDQIHLVPSFEKRILITLEELETEAPYGVLTVTDTGTGMDKWLIENYFLRVGRSYYDSADFVNVRTRLREADLDFAPVSEFGIGFLACFLLADRIEVETASWKPVRGDTARRKLQIDGPSRLIKVVQDQNRDSPTLAGTRVSLFLSKSIGGQGQEQKLNRDRLVAYLVGVCQDLPYTLLVECNGPLGRTIDQISPKSLTAVVPAYLEPATVRINVTDPDVGLEGQIALVAPKLGNQLTQALVSDRPITPEVPDPSAQPGSSLLRGGFRIGGIPGLPDSFMVHPAAAGSLRLTWQGGRGRKYPRPNLSRSRLADQGFVGREVARIWLSYLLEHVNELPDGIIYHLSMRGEEVFASSRWLEHFDAMHLYSLARLGWKEFHTHQGVDGTQRLEEWESGQGPPLWLGSFRSDLHWQLLDIVLPRITRLQMHDEGRFYVEPPIAGWRDKLTDCTDFIRQPVPWDNFVEYVGRYAEC